MRSEKMKTPVLIAIVVTLHCVAVALIICMQGCVTTGGDDVAITTEHPILPPPAYVAPTPVHTVPRERVREWPSKTVSYSVKSGETLSGIAQKNGVKVSELVRINGIADPNKLRSGEKILLPVGASRAPRTDDSTSKAPAPRPSLDGSAYVVKQGDSLSVIAVRHGVSVGALRAANGLSGDRILVDQKLVIPGKSAIEQDRIEIDDPEVEITPVPPVPVPSTRSAQPAREFIKLRVEKGDSLKALAHGYHTTVDDLKAINGLTSETLVPGTTIRIPID